MVLLMGKMGDSKESHALKTTGWIFDITLLCENSINQSKLPSYNQEEDGGLAGKAYCGHWRIYSGTHASRQNHVAFIMLQEEGLERTKKHDRDTINRRIMSSRTEAGGKTTMLKQSFALGAGRPEELQNITWYTPYHGSSMFL